MLKPKICNRVWNSTKNRLVFSSKKLLTDCSEYARTFLGEKTVRFFVSVRQTYCKFWVKKYALPVLVGVSIVWSGFLCLQRLLWEQRYKDVTIAVDSSDLFELALRQGRAFEKILDDAVTGGITALAVNEDTLANLKSAGRVEIIYGSPFIVQFSRTGVTYVLCREKELARRIARKLGTDAHLGNNQQGGRNWVVTIPGVDPDFEENAGLGFSQTLIQSVKKRGLKVILRPFSVNSLQEWQDWSQIETIVFAGKNLPGYPQDIPELQRILTSIPTRLGVIEFTTQQGLPALLSSPEIQKRIVRVHSISEKEIEDIEDEKRKVTFGILIDRWVRAVRERNVRLLYVHLFHHPIDDKEHKDIRGWNLHYIQQIAGRLRSAGFTFSSQPELPFLENSQISILFLGMGIFALTLLVLMTFHPITGPALKKIFVFGLLLLAVVVFSFSATTVAKAGALWASILIPLGMAQWIQKKASSFSGDNGWGAVALIFTQATCLTLAGVLLVTGFLYGQPFWLKINAFAGVKIALFLPLIVLVFSKRNWQIISGKIWRQPITVGTFICGTLIILLAMLYLWRSGNEGTMLISGPESSLRTWLDHILLVRPRTKEFLFGHPLLMLYIYQSIHPALARKGGGHGRKNFFLLVGGVIGQISVINTFVHVHTPLEISLLRTFHGWWLGILVGWLFVFIYEKLASMPEEGDQLCLKF